MIKTPYTKAFRIPAALFLLCLVKKLTVIGIIGKTQGVNKAAKPPKKLNKKEHLFVHYVQVADRNCHGSSIQLFYIAHC